MQSAVSLIQSYPQSRRSNELSVHIEDKIKAKLLQSYTQRKDSLELRDMVKRDEEEMTHIVALTSYEEKDIIE